MIQDIVVKLLPLARLTMGMMAKRTFGLASTLTSFDMGKWTVEGEQSESAEAKQCQRGIRIETDWF